MNNHPILVLVVLAVLATVAAGCGSTAPRPTDQPTATAKDDPEATTCPAPPPPLGGKAEPPTLVVQNGHTKGILGLSLDEQGRILASASGDGTVRVWDTRTGLMLRRVAAKGITIGVSLSSHGNVLAFRVHDGSEVRIMVVDVAAGGAPRKLSADGAFQVSPDGRHVAVGLHQLRLFQAGTGDLVKELAIGPIRALAFDPDGHQLVVSFDDDLVLVEVPSLKVIRRWKHPAYRDIRDVAASLVLQGNRIVLRTGMATYLTGTQPGAPVHTINRPLLDVAVRGDRVLAAEVTGRLSQWSLATGKEVTGGAAVSRVERVAVASGGSTVAIAATEGHSHVIRIVEGASLRPVRTLKGLTTGVTALAFRPDGKELVTGSSIGALARWNLVTGELVDRTEGEEANPSRALAYDRTGSILASVAGTWWVRVQDRATGRMTRQWPAHKPKQLAFAGFLPQGKELLTVDIAGAMGRWDLSAPLTPAPKRVHRFTEVARPPGGEIGTLGWKVARAALSPDGAWLAVVGDDQLMLPSGSRVVLQMQGRLAVVSTRDATVRWETQVVTGAGSRERWVAFSADGRTLLHSATETPGGGTRRARPIPVLVAYDADSGQEKRRVHPGTAGMVASIANVVAIGGRDPALLDWPNLAVRQRVATTSYESVVAGHRSSQRFAFAGEGGATTVVTAAGKPLAMLAATSSGEYVTATPSGAFLASLDGARNVAWTFPGPLEGFSFEQFAARFDRPDAVAQSLGTGSHAELGRLSRPPRVEADRRGWKPEVAARSVPLRATVSSSHRVDRVRVFVNGKLGAEQLVCAPRAEVKLDVPLLAGRNRITVIAYDAQGYASNPQVLDVRSTAADASRPDLWVVSVGVSRYPKMPAAQQLQFADDDARAITAAFAKQVGPGRSFAKLHPTTLVDREVTVKSLSTALGKLSQMKPDDLAVVFLAGHGVRLADGKMVLLTSGAALTRASAKAEGVGWDRIEATLKQAPGRVLLLLDACHSGHVSTEIIAPNEALARQLAEQHRTGVLVLAASRGSQLSYEVPPRSKTKKGLGSRGFDVVWEGRPPSRITRKLPTGHGLFTSAVLEALGGQAVDHDRSGAVEVGELIDYVTERVTTASKGKQTPWVARRELFGDFVIAPAGP
ncbi:MAG: caspase family protein [Deltaproteobacteria bacterium]|nr:caspase family protein [Deltaproteobacteria bacterium]